jgi:hypothetical protein
MNYRISATTRSYAETCNPLELVKLIELTHVPLVHALSSGLQDGSSNQKLIRPKIA